jgi:uncharacterized membrane protein (UPF0127 family)
MYFFPETTSHAVTPVIVAEREKVSGSTVQIGGKTVKVGVVDTPSGREKGLSGHPGLREDEGLLFVFENSEKFGFWMKDMLFAIDIIWINEQGKIVHIQKNATPESYPRIFIPAAEAKYVLEVVTGFSDAHKVSVGDTVLFSLAN